MWGVANGEVLLTSWGNNFAFIVIQDLTAVECLQILVINILAMVAVRPQLKNVYQTILNAAVAFVQED